MKKKYYLLSIILLNLFIVGCDTNDATFYKDVFITAPNLVRIETSPTGYYVNDKIYINCYIGRLLNVPNQNNLLDVRKSTGYSEKFSFSCLLEKKINATDWEIIDVNPTAIDVTSGSIFGGIFYLILYCLSRKNCLRKQVYYYS